MKDKHSSTQPATDQREALDESEREANARQPGSYKPEATDEKIVEVKPIDRKDSAIKGLDPK